MMDHVREIVLDLLNSYKNRVAAIERLIDMAYWTTLDPRGNGSLSKASKERKNLSIKLQETLARNCSLRKKDFEAIAGRVVLALKQEEIEIEEEQRRVEKRLRQYLSREKRRMDFVRKKLLESGGEDAVERALVDIKVEGENEVRDILNSLRDLNHRVGLSVRAQERLNEKMRGLLTRGDLLRIEDVKNLTVAETDGVERGYTVTAGK